MAIKPSEVTAILSGMEEPIRTVIGATDTLRALGTADDMTQESINFVADALYPEAKKLEELWQKWDRLHHATGEKES